MNSSINGNWILEHTQNSLNEDQSIVNYLNRLLFSSTSDLPVLGKSGIKWNNFESCFIFMLFQLNPLSPIFKQVAAIYYL